MPTRPCSHVRRTPQPAEESVDQRRRSRFTITCFSAHDDNRKKISRTRVSYGSNSRHTHTKMVTMPQSQRRTAGGTGKTTSRTFAEKVSAKKSPGGNGVHGPMIIVPRKRADRKFSNITRRHRYRVDTKWDSLNDDVTLARTISFSNSNYYINRAKQIYP
jgi:hypothetical protein